MTKPLRKKARVDDWTFDMPAGLATHHPTQLEFLLEPLPDGYMPEPQLQVTEAQGYMAMGKCWLPPNGQGLHIDRRDPTKIAPGHANSPGVTQWATLAHKSAVQAVFDKLRAEMGADNALKRFTAIAKDAGERWVFEVRKERLHKKQGD